MRFPCLSPFQEKGLKCVSRTPLKQVLGCVSDEVLKRMDEGQTNSSNDATAIPAWRLFLYPLIVLIAVPLLGIYLNPEQKDSFIITGAVTSIFMAFFILYIRKAQTDIKFRNVIFKYLPVMFGVMVLLKILAALI